MFMARIRNRICPHCSGRGFTWVHGKIVSRRDGSTIATTHKQGPDCEHCRGTGRCGLDAWAWTVAAVLALVLIAFVISPALHLIFD